MSIENMRILITGSNGFIGKNLLLRLRDLDVELALISTKPSTTTLHARQMYVGNIEDAQFVKKVINDFKPEVVYHLAANKHRLRSDSTIHQSLNTNLIGTLNLYENLVDLKCFKSIVSLGTMDEYGEAPAPYNETEKELPLTAYGLSKMMATKLAEFFYRTAHLPITVLRPTIAYGPFQGNEMFIPSLINNLLVNQEYRMTLGEQKRDFIYIDDLVDVMLKISESNHHKGQIFNTGFGQSFKLNEVALIVAKILNKESLLKIGAIDYRFGEQMEYSINNEAIKQAINWQPKIGLKEGLGRTIEHYKTIKNEQ